MGYRFICPSFPLGAKTSGRRLFILASGTFSPQSGAKVFPGRFDEADLIVMLLLGRVPCFFRAYGRYLKYKGRTRPDMAEGCGEKFDREFAKWFLYKGRSKRARERYKKLREDYPEKTVILKTRRAVDRFEREYGLT
ncbi:MAG: hypothetical protein ILO42_05735 [Clostridia bacterium]|nr:hypothetical protein [Clostridia bacterium]